MIDNILLERDIGCVTFLLLFYRSGLCYDATGTRKICRYAVIMRGERRYLLYSHYRLQNGHGYANGIVYRV